MTKEQLIGIVIIISFLGCSKENEINNPKSLRISIKEISSSSSEILTDIAFGDSNTTYVCGAMGALLKSKNTGLNWSQIPTGLYQSLNCIQALNKQQVYMARNDLYYSPDGGETWQGHGLDNFGSQIHELLFLNSNVGYILKNGIMQTTNAGITWTHVFDSGSDNAYPALVYTEIQFIDSNTGYCAGGKSYDGVSIGNILKTTNGGENWYSLNFETSQITAFYFFDASIGYIFNFNKELWKTTNGGSSWSKVSSSVPYSYPDCYFLNTDTIILKTANEIIHTTDGGVSWVKDYTVSNQNIVLTRMKFFEKYKGYVIGHEGFIAKIALEFE